MKCDTYKISGVFLIKGRFFVPINKTFFVMVQFEINLSFPNMSELFLATKGLVFVRSLTNEARFPCICLFNVPLVAKWFLYRNLS